MVMMTTNMNSDASGMVQNSADTLGEYSFLTSQIYADHMTEQFHHY